MKEEKIMGHYGMAGYGSMYGGSGIFSMLLMVLFWALVIAGVYFLIRWVLASAGTGGKALAGGNALDFAKQRYARGEISRDEFEQIKKDLA